MGHAFFTGGLWSDIRGSGGLIWTKTQQWQPGMVFSVGRHGEQMQRVHSRRNVFLVLLLFFSELRLAQTVQPSKIAIAKTFMERSACLKRAFVHERFLQCYFSLWAASHGIPPRKVTWWATVLTGNREGWVGGVWKQRQRGRESSHYFSLIAHERPSWFPPLQPGRVPHYRQPPQFSQEKPMKRPWKASSDRGQPDWTN